MKGGERSEDHSAVKSGKGRGQCGSVLLGAGEQDREAFAAGAGSEADNSPEAAEPGDTLSPVDAVRPRPEPLGSGNLSYRIKCSGTNGTFGTFVPVVPAVRGDKRDMTIRNVPFVPSRLSGGLSGWNVPVRGSLRHRPPSRNARCR